jgi:hypothetical protein
VARKSKAICLLEKHLTRANRAKQTKKLMVVEMGRISVALSDEVEKKLSFKTVERFGGRKGDLSRAVEEVVKTWVAKEN